MLISSAYAQSSLASAENGGLLGFLPIVLVFVVGYFLIIRPQMKRQKDHKNVIDGLQKGDEVVTSAGILGRISKIGDSYLTLEVASLTEKQPVDILVQRITVQTVLPKGTLKDQR